MRGRAIAATALAVLALPVAAAADEEATFQPAGGTGHTYASWKANEGLSDSTGFARQAFYLQHFESPFPGAAAGIFQGLAGRRVAMLTSLEWERRWKDSICTATDPRWTLTIQGRSRREYVVRFGCQTSLHSPGKTPNWIRDTNTQSVIRARILREGGTDALGGRILELAIVVDRSFGYAFLDNIRVGKQMWTSAADNGDFAATSPVEFLAPDERPLTEAETMPAEDLLASLTFDEEWQISDEGMAALEG